MKVTLLSAQQAAAYYDPEKSSGAYATLDAYLADLVDFTRREIAELGRLGCEYVQIDAPQYAALLDEKIREGYRQRGADPGQAARRVHRARQRHHRGPPGITFGIHICRGNHQSMFYASGGYDRIAQQVFGRSHFDRFLLEYDDDRSGTFEPLQHMPGRQGRRARPGQLEEDRRWKRSRASRRGSRRRRSIVPLDRLAISPQCGFASTHEGNRLTPATSRSEAGTGRHGSHGRCGR